MKVIAELNRRCWIGLVVVGLSLCLVSPMPTHAEDAKTIRLEIDYSDGVEKHFNSIAWKDGMTVFDAMNAAKMHARGITFEYKGRGATVLLTKIDDVANEGRGRNWLYRVNGAPGDRSIGIFELKAGDTVLWKFDKYK